ncbi:metal ABC transporter solute-binding protein, Zn/Mn family [Microbacterium sp.]|uniref:metal ABC transporter solute-binding protein, Zn/Mn family n=1 Tax=Microbacterium sp. TaxID=51671 RepID=UPI0039E6C385
MPRKNLRPALVPAVLTAAALLLSGCSGSASPSGTSDGGTIAVVASTNVYGQIAETVGGDHVEVTSLIASFSQDPHEFEASASDQLTVKNAQLVIENGGGYDPFVDSLVEAAGTSAPLISAVAFSPQWSGDDPTQPVEGFNEHVFYDPQVMVEVADEIATQLGKIDPDAAAEFTANAQAFADDIAAQVTPILDEVAAAHSGEKFFVTEPVPAYLAEAAGLVNVTPDAFSEAVEEGNDVPPATLLEALNLIGSGDVKVVFINAQAAGAETTEVENKAAEVSVPVIKASELLPDGKTYVTWMADMATQLQNALSQ